VPALDETGDQPKGGDWLIADYTQPRQAGGLTVTAARAGRAGDRIDPHKIPPEAEMSRLFTARRANTASHDRSTAQSAAGFGPKHKTINLGSEFATTPAEQETGDHLRRLWDQVASVKRQLDDTAS